MGEAIQTMIMQIFGIIVLVLMGSLLFQSIYMSTAFNNENSYGSLAKNIAFDINYVSMADMDSAIEYTALPDANFNIDIDKFTVEIITEKGVKFGELIHGTDKTDITPFNEPFTKENKKVLCIIKEDNVITFSSADDKSECI